MPNIRESIVYTCLRGNSVLAERRALNSPYAPGEIVFPGGKIDPGDKTPLQAFLREFQEETAAEPQCVIRLHELEYPEDNIRLFPFVVYTWNGDIPQHMVDTNGLFLWRTIEFMRQSSRTEVATLANLIMLSLVKLTGYN